MTNEKNIELKSPQRIKEIRFRTQKGKIVTGFFDTSAQIVRFNEFIKDVSKLEEVKDERKAESEEI